MGMYSTQLEEKEMIGSIEKLFELIRNLEQDVKVLEDKVEDISQQWTDLGEMEYIIFGSSVDGFSDDGLLKRVQELEYKMENK